MDKRKGRKFLTTTATMKDAKSTAIPNTHKAVASNNSVTMIDLNEPRGQELTEDVNWFEDLQHEGQVFPLPDTPVKPPTKNTIEE